MLNLSGNKRATKCYRMHTGNRAKIIIFRNAAKKTCEDFAMTCF